MLEGQVLERDRGKFILKISICLLFKDEFNLENGNTTSKEEEANTLNR